MITIININRIRYLHHLRQHQHLPRFIFLSMEGIGGMGRLYDPANTVLYWTLMAYWSDDEYLFNDFTFHNYKVYESLPTKVWEDLIRVLYYGAKTSTKLNCSRRKWSWHYKWVNFNSIIAHACMHLFQAEVAWLFYTYVPVLLILWPCRALLR